MRERLQTLGSVLSTMPQWRLHHLADWANSVRGTRSPVDEQMPWLSWGCIDWLEQHVRPGLRVLEYGGGGSTMFFLSRGCHVTTVEGNAQWVEDLRTRTNSYRDRCELRFVNSQLNEPQLEAEYVAQARTGAPWDIILVDGAFRGGCVAVARECIVPGGAIIVDNTDLPEYADVRPERALHGFERKVFRTLGYARVKPTTTEVFVAPS